MRLQSEETSETIEMASQNLLYSRFPTILLVSCLVLVKYQQIFPTIITSSAFCSTTPSELYILSRTGADYIPQPSCNKSKFRSPITCCKGLQLANSLISGKSVLESVDQWKKRYCISFRDQDGAKDTKVLGMGYWRARAS